MVLKKELLATSGNSVFLSPVQKVHEIYGQALPEMCGCHQGKLYSVLTELGHSEPIPRSYTCLTSAMACAALEDSTWQALYPH